MSKNPIPTGDLATRYRAYLRELETTRNVRVGFRVFLGGVGLAALALVLFLWANTYDAHTSAYYAWSEPAYALSMLSIPVAMLGIVILLPSERRLLGVAVGGLVVTVIATGWFTLAYPADWNHYGDDHTLSVVTVYAIGLAGLSVATGASLRAHSPELIRAVTEIDRSESEPDSETIRVGDGSSSDGVSRVTVDGRSGADGSTAVTVLVNGEPYTFGDGETFGRQDAAWLEDLIAVCDGPDGVQRISNDHLEFAARDDGVYVVDRSRNGTSVNGRGLEGGEAKLSDGDTLVLGGVAELEVRL